MKTTDVFITVAFNDLIIFLDDDNDSLTSLNNDLKELLELLNIETDILELHQEYLNSGTMYNKGDMIIYNSMTDESKLVLDLAIEGDGYDLINLGCIFNENIKYQVIEIFRKIFDNSHGQVGYEESSGKLEQLIELKNYPREIDVGYCTQKIIYRQKLIFK